MFQVRSLLLRAPVAGASRPLQRVPGLVVVSAALLFASCRESAGPDAVAPSRAAAPTTEAEPAGTAAGPRAITPIMAPGSVSNAASTAPSSAGSAAAHSATAPTTSAVEEAALLAVDGTPLPQTDDRPRSDTPAFRQRIERLVEAIAKDEPELAHSAFFPVVAYAQVKAIAKPERDWEQRLVRAFDRTIHEYHRALGADAAGARLVAVEVPDTARYMKPGSEGNRVGYYRVLRSRLLLETADEKSHSLEITSLISWRGEWYVVHLKGFQ